MITENRGGQKKMTKKELSNYKKMSPEEVQGLIAMRKRGGVVKSKKGKGSYDRKAFKKGVA
jgi:stalled ribosome alternative rescue factor ArfA